MADPGAGQPALFSLPSPFQTEWGELLLLEPPTADAATLRQQLLDDTYGKPFIVDDGSQRFLYFNTRLMQSAMRHAAPNALELRYTQKMVAFLLFCPRPKRLLLIGLGGGSLVKFCHQHLPGAHLTAVEINPHVIALRAAFAVPPDDARLQTIEGDGAATLRTLDKGLDIILLDAFDHLGFAPGFADRDFFQTAFDKLSGKGVLVVNLAGDKREYGEVLSAIAEVFDSRTLLISVADDGNHVLFAFKETYFDPRWRWVHSHAKELRARTGLDFPAFARKLENASRRVWHWDD